MQDVYYNALRVAQNYIGKMGQSHAIYGGVIGGVLAIPAWIESDTPTIEHAVMMAILVLTLFIDWLTGTALARRSPVTERTSHVGNYSIIRDFIIVALCVMAIGLDYVCKTRSIIFAVFTAAFIWQNFYSVLGNVITLGWDKHFPFWLFNLIKRWVNDEVKSKQHKYFPKGDNKQ